MKEIVAVIFGLGWAAMRCCCAAGLALGGRRAMRDSLITFGGSACYRWWDCAWVYLNDLSLILECGKFDDVRKRDGLTILYRVKRVRAGK